VKIFKNLLKILIVIAIFCVGTLIIVLNSTFGDFAESVYDLFANPILFFVYLLLTLIFIIWTNRQIRKKYYLLFFIPIVFTLMSFVWKQNLHKNTTLATTIILGIIFEESEGSSIKLYDDNTFVIRIQHPHIAYFKKGIYKKNGNEILLKENSISELTNGLFNQKYIINENKTLVSYND